MELLEKDLNLIPDMKYIKFEPAGDHTLITTWEGYNSLSQVSIASVIEKECIIDNKILKMMKLLIKGLTKLTINVSAFSFVVKSANGTYTGKKITPERDISNTFNFESCKIYPYSSEIIGKAIGFASDNSKARPVLQGVNIGEKGVVATDSFKMYVYGSGNYKCQSITVDKKFLSKICKFGFKEIKSDGNQVCIIDDKGVSWYSVLLDGNYPDVNRILENKGEELSLDVNALSKPIALAISSLEEIKDDILELKGEVFFSCKDKKLTISTNLYRNEFDVNAIDFEFNLFAKHTKLIVDLDVKKVFYKDSKHPLFMELAENEIAMFLPLTKKGGN